MRLTDEVLTASDRCTDQMVGRVLMLASARQFGLIPSSTPFMLNVNPAGGFLHVEALNCLAVTKGGELIDVAYDTRFANTFDTRVVIPEVGEGEQLLLTIQPKPGEWRETGDGYGEPVYTFALLSPDSPVPDDAMPIARVVNQYGWHIDEEDFVPPCILVAAHPKYVEAYQRFLQLLREMESKAHALLNTDAQTAMRIFWPLLQQILIETDKERDVASPMSLLKKVQQCVSAFYCACELDDYLDLADADEFRAYALAPYNYKEAYPRIREGIQICASISEKLDKMKEAPADEPEPEPDTIQAPYIEEAYLRIGCSGVARVPITCPEPGASVYFSLDGTEPSANLLRAPFLALNTGYNKQRSPEPERIVHIKLKAVKDGISSPTTSFQVTLWKDFSKFGGPEI